MRLVVRRRKDSVSIEQDIWKGIKRIQKGKVGRKLGARTPTALVEKVLIAFIVNHDSNYAEYLRQAEAMEKALLSLDDNKIKSATPGDLDRP